MYNLKTNSDMPAYQLYITAGGTEYDAYTEWGVSLSDTAIATLMAPCAKKDDIVNESRLEHGKRHASAGNYLQERELSLPIHLSQRSKTAYMTKYIAFRNFLHGNENFTIRTSHESGVVYHVRYVSCTQFTQFINGMAKLMLRVVEPNPGNRT